VQLAEVMGVAQQTLAHYEAGRLRLLAGALPTLADQLGVTVEDLIATPKRNARKRGPASKLQQQLERISALPKAQQRFVMQMLDTVLQQQGG
jgi:transcriptional regulator with XRE-family HTH domain